MDHPLQSSSLTLLLLACLTACSTTASSGMRQPTDAAVTASLAPAPQEGTDAATGAMSTVTTTGLDGNRIAPGTLGVDTPPLVLSTDIVPTVLLAAPLEDGHLLVATDRSEVRAWIVTSAGIAEAPDEILAGLGEPPAEGRPALLRDGDHWRFTQGNGQGDTRWRTPAGDVRRDGDRVRFGDAIVQDVLPDARWAVAGSVLAVPVRPTDEYGHGVLGDAIEAAALAVADADTGAVEVHTFPGAAVLEGTGVVLADVDGDGGADPVLTLSRDAVGARQAVLLDGEFVLGEPIGRGNRWRHTLGVDDGRILEVVTPHLARVFQVVELGDENTLRVTVSEADTIASHSIGSRDLDMAGLVDVTGDGTADVLGPAAGSEALRVLDGRTGAAVRDIGLPARQVSNLALFTDDRTAVAALGTEDGHIVVLGVSR